jgi:mannose-6-phosphate isomerase-like protein (cupin superfamily)
MYCSIIVKGHLDRRWSEWFDGMNITSRTNGTTIVAGHLPDQTALHGMLAKVRDLSLSLVSVQCEDRAPARWRGLQREGSHTTAAQGRITPTAACRVVPYTRKRDKEQTMAAGVTQVEIPQTGNTYTFEGSMHGDAPVSFFVVNAPPGGGPRLHRHPYAEVFVVQEGLACFTAGADTLEVGAGRIVVVPPGMPHKFVNSGNGPLRQINIHPVGSMITDWLEE